MTRAGHTSTPVRLHLLFALVSGACLALSFPRFGSPAFAWIALVPLLVALTGWRGRPEPLPGWQVRVSRDSYRH